MHSNILEQQLAITRQLVPNEIASVAWIIYILTGVLLFLHQAPAAEIRTDVIQSERMIVMNANMKALRKPLPDSLLATY